MERPIAAETTRDGAIAREIIEESLTDNDMIHPGMKRTIKDLIEWQDAEIARLKVEVRETHDLLCIGDKAREDAEARVAELEDLIARLDRELNALRVERRELTERNTDLTARVAELEERWAEDRELRERLG